MAKLVTVFGGSGFVGRHLVRALAQRGWRVRVAVRRPDLAGFLQPLGGVGQVQAVQANVRNPASVAHAVAGADAVVNLVGILSESGRNTFGAVQAAGARTVAEAVAAAGVRSFVHMSALSANASSVSDYAASKAYGEQAALKAVPNAVIMRASVIFGPEDKFFNRFASIARMSPVIPLIGGGETRFQPVFVGDVAEAIAVALEGKAKPGMIYELGGPEVASFKTLMEYVLKETGRTRMPVKLPFWAARMQASVLQILPKAPLTVDQVNLLEYDSIVSPEAAREGRTLAGLGISPTTYESVVPSYLYRFREHGQFERSRAAS
ncbi:MAG TPA: complex I NDUFA9 subunit family protein [Beijerinckiaceae bacterium]|nr:complex I NDUFA9 subunit family protein [Beijerinckiaceae bacterium]